MQIAASVYLLTDHNALVQGNFPSFNEYIYLYIHLEFWTYVKEDKWIYILQQIKKLSFEFWSMPTLYMNKERRTKET